MKATAIPSDSLVVLLRRRLLQGLSSYDFVGCFEASAHVLEYRSVGWWNWPQAGCKKDEQVSLNTRTVRLPCLHVRYLLAV